MTMRERRKLRREARRAAFRSVVAGPSYDRRRRKRTARRSTLRYAMAATALLSVLTTTLFVAPRVARAGFGDAPEIDPGSIGGAMTLLIGGVLALTDRIRRA